MLGNIWISSALVVIAIFSTGAIYKSYSDIKEAKQIQEHYEIVKDIKTKIALQYNLNPDEITRDDIIAHLPKGENWEKILLLDRDKSSNISNKELINAEGNITISADERLKVLALRAKLLDNSQIEKDGEEYNIKVGIDEKNSVKYDKDIEKSIDIIINVLAQDILYSGLDKSTVLNTVIEDLLIKHENYYLFDGLIKEKKEIFFKSKIKEKLYKNESAIETRLYKELESLLWIKLFFIFIFLSNIAFSLDLNDFEERKSILEDVKSIILYEESIAIAYENYILSNYSIPNLAQIKVLIGDLTTQVSGITTTLTLNNSAITKISYALSDDLKKADASIKALYDSNTFRKRTYVRNNEVYFILEDVFAKHLYDLIKTNGEIINADKPLISCSLNKVCKKNNHIYVEVQSLVSDMPDKYLMAYHIDKFKTGPIIITNDTSKYLTESIFNSIPKGALLYDITGVKYLKTVSGIEVLK